MKCAYGRVGKENGVAMWQVIAHVSASQRIHRARQRPTFIFNLPIPHGYVKGRTLPILVQRYELQMFMRLACARAVPAVEECKEGLVLSLCGGENLVCEC